MKSGKRSFFGEIVRKGIGVVGVVAWLSPSPSVAKSLPLTLWYDRPATVWMTSALPIGNGTMGAMFFGGVKTERVQFNEKSLWTGSPTVRGSYQNFGDMLFEFDTDSLCTDYRRELSLDNAVGRVTYESGGVRYERKYMASHPDKVVIVRIETPESRGKVSFTLRLKGSHGEATRVDGNVMTFSGAFETICYEAQAVVMAEGGATSSDGDAVTVRNADAVTVALTCGTNYDIASPTYATGDAKTLHSRLSSIIDKVAKKSFARLQRAHEDDYRSLFNRVELTLAKTPPTCTTDELVRRHAADGYIDMLYFQYGRYLTIASSRGGDLPSNLQGLWNDSNTPPWQSDYHSNINVEMNYWPTEVAGLSECFSPFVRYVHAEATKADGSWRKVAEKENCRGWALHTQSNIFGHTDWNINRPANAWYCTHLWSHYEYTLDKKFLREKAWPVMRLACQYWFDRLVEKDGLLVAPTEWSPEHGPWTDGPAYAQQLVSALFKQTLAAAEVLKVGDAFVKELANKYSLIDKGLHVGGDGALREWLTICSGKDSLHRHLSHLIALYPCDGISYLKDSLVANAAKKSLQSRGDGGTGWSRAWKVACWARLGDGERAYKLLKRALNPTEMTALSMNDKNGGVYPNLFCAHPPFQIDGNFGATAGIAEMLLQNTVRGIQLLPALPLAWSAGEFKGLRAKGGFSLDLEWRGMKPLRAVVHSAKAQPLRIYSPDIAPRKVVDEKGGEVEFFIDGDGTITLKAEKGNTYTITFE